MILDRNRNSVPVGIGHEVAEGIHSKTYPTAILARTLHGFSFVELTIGMGIFAILAAFAIPTYQSYIKRAKVAHAVADIMTIVTLIGRYSSTQNSPPPDLVTIGCGNFLDPWGRPYVYLSFTGLKGKGKMRKDKNLVPINTAYDLYSVGADGQSKPPLTVPVSKDDVILANDGNYIGLASNY